MGEQLYAYKRSKERFRRDLVSYVLFVTASVYSIVLAAESPTFLSLGIAFYINFKSLLLALFPILRFWILNIHCGVLGLQRVHLGGLEPEMLELNTSEVNINEEEQNGEHNICAICFMDYEHGDSARRLRCDHMFHKGCIDEWFARSTTCPLCKSD